MKKNIITVKDLYVEGKMIAFIKGNRSVNSKNISRKKKSFEKFGMNLVPLMYVDGQKAVNDGCTLVHPITKERIYRMKKQVSMLPLLRDNIDIRQPKKQV